MKKLFIVLIFVVGLGALLWLMLSKNSTKSVTHKTLPKPASGAQISSPSNIASQVTSSVTQVVRSLGATYPRWEGGRAIDLNDPRWQVLNQRDKTDRAWRGKVEIEFYGKVVDEKNSPVEGATIKFSKGDLSSEGTTQLNALSDSNGLFSLTGVIGRGLGITVEKGGYYTSKLNQYAFEYAEFSNENFHQPDSRHPVVFGLMKKQIADTLIFREHELPISLDAVAEINLDAGGKLQIELLKNSRPKERQWVMRVAMVNGGLQASTEEFPFFAPTNGYVPNLVLSDSSPKPPKWPEIYEGGVFYLSFGANNYGRIEIQMISGNDWLRVKSWMNPKSGSRNLEFDPAKSLKP